MRSVLISDKKTGKTKNISEVQNSISTIEDIEHNSTIIEKAKNLVQNIERKIFPISTISEKEKTSVVSSVLPFRIRITNIGIPSYGPNNPAPIGIAIIGVNNYIL